MAVSAVLAPAVTQTSSLGIFTLFYLSTERIPKQIGHPSSPPTPPQPPPLPQQQHQTPLPAPPPPPSSSSSSQPPSLAHTDSSLSSSPRHFPTDLSHPILEEEGDESESDTPNEPVTPVSGRQSQDFHTLQSHDNHPHDANSAAIGPDAAAAVVRPDAVHAKPPRPPVTIN